MGIKIDIKMTIEMDIKKNIVFTHTLTFESVQDIELIITGAT